MSIAAHLLLVGAFVGASGPRPVQPSDPTMRPVFYLPPPNRPLTDPAGVDRIKYVSLGAAGAGSGPGVPTGEDQTKRRATASSGEPGSSTAVPAESALPRDDEPVFTVIEVDEEAARVANSAAPAYPPTLLAEGIEGMVLVRYVVDADGLADSSSLQVISATHAEFANAVRAALPYMRFTPARIDTRPVKQLVEQPFSFRIRRAADADTANAKGPPGSL